MEHDTGFGYATDVSRAIAVVVVLLLAYAAPLAVGADSGAVESRPLRISADYAQLFRSPDNRHAVVLQGNVNVQCGRRKASADEAVVWIDPGRPDAGGDGPTVYGATVFLQGNPKVKAPKATVTTPGQIADARLLRVDTTGRVFLTAQTRIEKAGHDLPLYQRALRCSERVQGEAERAQQDKPAKPAAQPKETTTQEKPHTEQPSSEDLLLPDDNAAAQTPSAGEKASPPKAPEATAKPVDGVAAADLLLHDDEGTQLTEDTIAAGRSDEPGGAGQGVGADRKAAVGDGEPSAADILEDIDLPRPARAVRPGGDAELLIEAAQPPMVAAPPIAPPVEGRGESKDEDEVQGRDADSDRAEDIERDRDMVGDRPVDEADVLGEQWRGVSLPAKPPVHLVPGGTIVSLPQAEDTDVLMCTGGLYVYQDIPPGGLLEEQSLLELRAQNAVVFYNQKELFRQQGSLLKVVSGVYLEGDVVMQAGYHSVMADKLYYDFTQDRALVINAALSAVLPGQNLPVYARAARIRQLSLDRFAAERLQLSNDEFADPGLSLRAAEAELEITRKSAEAPARVRYDLKDITVNVGELPFFIWPRAVGTSARTPVPIKRVHTSYDGDYGMSVESTWHLAELLGLVEPDGVDSTLRVDEFTKRGPGGGVDVEYARQEFFGRVNSYIVQDKGEDDLGRMASRDDHDPLRTVRGRARWQHRHYLPLDWQATFEVSYLSDPDFLESWEEKEFDTDKGQETVAYFKQQRDNWAFDFLSKWGLNDFEYTQTELPTAGCHVAGQDILSRLTYYQDSFVSRLSDKADARDVPGFGDVYEPSILPGSLDQNDYAMGVSRHEIAMPLQMGPIRFVPTAIGTYVFNDRDLDNSLLQGAGGFRAATQLWHVDNGVESRLWDLHRMRHIIIPEMNVFFVQSDDDDRDNQDVFNVALRQRFQTMRGPASERYSVDFLRWDISATFVNHDIDDSIVPGQFLFSSPEYRFERTPFLNDDLANVGLARREMVNQCLSDHVTTDWTWLISDTTAFIGHMNYNIHDGVLSHTRGTIAVQRTPRTSYYVGHRFTHDGDLYDGIDSQFITGAAHYRINRKYTFAVANRYDIVRTSNSNTEATIIRKFRHWYGAFSVSFDPVDDNFSVSVSFWPEGFDKIAIGSRRFTRLVR